MKKSIFLFLLLSATSVKAQTGFFIYHDTIQGKPHVQIIDIKEGSDKNIYIAGESKDDEFQSTSPWFLQVDARGKMLAKSALSAEVTDIKRLILAPEMKNMLYGNTTSTGGKPQPYSSLLTQEGRTTNINVMAMSYAMILADALPFSKTQTLIIQSDRNKETQLFNLALIKVPNNQYSPRPFATVTSNYNEVATQAVLNARKDLFITGFRFNGEDLEPIVYAIDSSGKKLWDVVVDIPTDFENLKISLDKSGNVLLTAGYRNNAVGNSHSILWKADANGKQLSQIELPNIKSNGMLLLKNGNTLVYGADFMVHDNRFIISKGSFMVLDDKLKILQTDKMVATDSPDKDLTSAVISAKPTSSEFNTGIQLSDGRIILGGRITYPESTAEDAVYYNQACLLFLSEKLTFRK